MVQFGILLEKDYGVVKVMCETSSQRDMKRVLELGEKSSTKLQTKKTRQSRFEFITEKGLQETYIPLEYIRLKRTVREEKYGERRKDHEN